MANISDLEVNVIKIELFLQSLVKQDVKNILVKWKVGNVKLNF